MLSTLLVAGLSYLIGSIPFAVIVSAAMGLQDPRKFGSKNPGATNVLRSGNKKAAALTLIGDTLKGVLAVCLCLYAVNTWGLNPGLVGVSALAVFLGHVYPFTLKFKGGKGVATSLGILFALQPLLGLFCLLTWLFVFYVSRYSSLSAIIAAISAPIYYYLGSNVVWPFNGTIGICLILISIVLLVRHQNNISRLLQGKEPKVGTKKS
ncbi:MAG TPA: glycerol-3-phosphate 1-O-acyltransferase PlsY [Paenalcaligenes sp.]|nr:glycerol-3-phosphate 1-O-acyltransferase PlsY [Paenalcaligenes sp.]